MAVTEREELAALMVGIDVPDDPLALFFRRPAWMADAACRETPSVSFFPEHGETAEDARAVCSGCQVREACRSFAVAGGEDHGVWGGLSPQERKALTTKAPRRPRQPTARRQSPAPAAALQAEVLGSVTAGWRRAALAARAKRTA